jgi:DNA-directed RNA polymerase I, II, and III subunit RPABC2
VLSAIPYGKPIIKLLHIRSIKISNKIDLKISFLYIDRRYISIYNYCIITMATKKVNSLFYGGDEEDDDNDDNEDSDNDNDNDNNINDSNIDNSGKKRNTSTNTTSENNRDSDEDEDSDIENDKDSDDDNYNDSDNDDIDNAPEDQDNKVPSDLIRDLDDISDYESDDDENYLQKITSDYKKKIADSHHPESNIHNHEEIDTLAKVVRNSQGTIIDPLHQTLPFMTKYEKARILGERAKQINAGAKPFIEIGPDIIDGYEIALRELDAKRIPFILKRPLPNGGVEYWKLIDLEML